MSKIARKMTDLVPDSPYIDSIERAQTSYFNWLIHQVYMDEYCGTSYYVLAKLLHNMEFYWTLELDENRAKDGVRLRHIWFDSINAEADALGVPRPMFPLDSLAGPCSVLEMLIALATRIESDIMQDDEIGNRNAVWLFQMLYHLGIAQYNDETLGARESNHVMQAVTNMMDRKYEADGSCGGLFPLFEPNGRDLREVDIWWQAQLWLAENYPERNFC